VGVPGVIWWAFQAWPGGRPRRGLGGVLGATCWDLNLFLCRYCKIYINYRGARQIAWLMFQTLLRRSALAAVFSSVVWVRDKEAGVRNKNI
jgi:hypothetical protein